MSQLQVDSISSMGGGHVDGAGKVVQFKEAVNTTEITIASGVTTSILTLNFTPKFSDSLILCQGFHSQDLAVNLPSYGYSRIFAGATEVARVNAVGYNIEKIPGTRFHPSYSGSVASWGTTSLAITIEVTSLDGVWSVSYQDKPTSLLVWEIAQ